MAKFVTPVIQDNPSGWGPCAVPEQFKDMPYQPFSKGDRLGKVPVPGWAMSSGCLLGPPCTPPPVFAAVTGAAPRAPLAVRPNRL